MIFGITGKARLILLGSILVLLSFSSFAILRGLSSSSPSPPVSRLMPTLNYLDLNGYSHVYATITLSNGCLSLTSWGTPDQTGNTFSVSATVVDASGPGTFCTQMMSYPQHTYTLGILAIGNYSFTLSACTMFPKYAGVVDCSNKTSVFFQVGISDHKPPIDDNTLIEFQDINGHSIVNATITVPPCSRLRGWSDPSQSGNSFMSNVTMVNDSRLMIACIAIDTFAQNTYDLGHLAPGLYSFTLNICEVSIGWGMAGTNTSIDCSKSHTIFFVVPGMPAPQPPPSKEWYMIFGQFAIIIIILLRVLQILFGGA